MSKFNSNYKQLCKKRRESQFKAQVHFFFFHLNVNVYYLNIVHQLFSFKISFNLTDHIENSRGAHLTDETSDRS